MEIVERGDISARTQNAKSRHPIEPLFSGEWA
jgi:hypothetical protein